MPGKYEFDNFIHDSTKSIHQIFDPILLRQFHLQSAAIPALDAAARLPDAALAGADEAGPRGRAAEQEVALLSRLSGTQGLLSSISQAQASARKGHQIRSGK